MQTITTYPVPCTCGNHEPKMRLSAKMMHTKKEPCPLVGSYGQDKVARGTCCSSEDQDLVAILRAWHESALASSVQKAMTAEDASVFADALQAVCRVIVFHIGDEDESSPHAHRLFVDISRIQSAADRYRKIGEAGFGVNVHTRG